MQLRLLALGYALFLGAVNAGAQVRFETVSQDWMTFDKILVADNEAGAAEKKEIGPEIPPGEIFAIGRVLGSFRVVGLARTIVFRLSPDGQVRHKWFLDGTVEGAVMTPRGPALVGIFDDGKQVNYCLLSLNAQLEVTHRHCFGKQKNAHTAYPAMQILAQSDGQVLLVRETGTRESISVERFDESGKRAWARSFAFSGACSGYEYPIDKTSAIALVDDEVWVRAHCRKKESIARVPLDAREVHFSNVDIAAYVWQGMRFLKGRTLPYPSVFQSYVNSLGAPSPAGDTLVENSIWFDSVTYQFVRNIHPILSTARKGGGIGDWLGG